jgi:hypothetical protein
VGSSQFDRDRPSQSWAQGSQICTHSGASSANPFDQWPIIVSSPGQKIMSFDEIVEEVPKLTGEERDALRSYLDQYEAMENEAIDEGLRSLKEEPMITFEELDRRISEKFGWK